LAKTRITESVIRKLPIPEKGQVDYFDQLNPHLCVRVGHGGAKTFFAFLRVDGKQTRTKLGRWPGMSLQQARVALRALRDRLLSDDPAGGQRKVLFSELAGLYLTEHARRFKKRWKEDERILGKDLLPLFGNVFIHKISSDDVRVCFSRILERDAPIAANRTRALLRKIFEFAIERDLLSVNPCARVRAPAKEKSRDRVLSENEIGLLWAALPLRSRWFQDYLKTLLLTGQRKSEVLEMRWSEVDLSSSVWTIPSERAKNDGLHRVPLTSPVLTILKERRLLGKGNDFVFGPEGEDRPRSDIRRQFEHLVKAVGAHFTPHDIRRTVATQLGSLRVDRTVIGKILNHSDSSVTRVYDRFSYDDEKREALGRWAEKLEKIAASTQRAA
jgi:integrase